MTEYQALDSRLEAGEIEDKEFERLIYPIIERRFEVEKEICVTTATTVEGLTAQIDMFCEDLGRDCVREIMGGMYVKIIDSLRSGAKNVLAQGRGVKK